MEDSLAIEFCQLSLNAISENDEGEALKIRAFMNNKVMLILVDSGSSHSFVSMSFVNKLCIQLVPVEPQQVRLANGEILITDKKVSQLTWWKNGYTMQADMNVLDQTTYGVTLGFDWLKARSPITCHWGNKQQ